MAFTAASLAIQSFCFREFKERPQLIAKLRECGLSRLELCARHADFSDESTFDGVIAEFRAAGIALDSIGVQHFRNEEAKERTYFEFAKCAGIRVISADFAPDLTLANFRAAERLADRYDINLAIHNHGGRHWLGNKTILEAIFANTSARIGLCLDTAWALDAGENPVELATHFAKRLYAVHIKDFTFDRARKHTDVVPGTGNLDLAKLLAAVAAAPDVRCCALEYEGEPKNPSPAIIQCVAAIKAAAGAKQESAHAR